MTEIILNLIDAGLNDDEINTFINSNSQKEQIKILQNCRKRLIEIYHNDAKQIDCLDYLLRKLIAENT